MNAALVGLALVLASCTSAPAAAPCAGATSYIQIDTRAHRLSLCDGSTLHRAFKVRLGKGGVRKTREGDGKTPLGWYALGAPRPSTRFGTFIPIGYPTGEQRAAGYTGSAVGVHGPHRLASWIGPANNWFDTTDGCVGLATDTETAAIAAWVTRRRATTIRLE